jgi:lipid kinase YegS
MTTDNPFPPAGRTRRIVVVSNRPAEADEAFTAAIEENRARGHEIDVRPIDHPSEASRLAQEAVAAGVDTVVAAGGDGTLHGVLNGVLQEGRAACSVGLVPFGTGNDFATACGIPADDPGLAFRLAIETRAVPIDVGRVNGHWFVNAASGGFGAEVTTDTPQGLKQMLGRFAYFVTGLVQFTQVEPRYARLVAPEFGWEGDLLALAVANGPQAGGGFRLAPQALLDDGLFDVVVIPNVSWTELGTLLGDYMTLHPEASLDHVVYSRVPWVEVHTREEMQVNVDGEPIHGTLFRFELRPQALPFHLLPTAPLRE